MANNHCDYMTKFSSIFWIGKSSYRSAACFYTCQSFKSNVQWGWEEKLTLLPGLCLLCSLSWRANPRALLPSISCCQRHKLWVWLWVLWHQVRLVLTAEATTHDPSPRSRLQHTRVASSACPEYPTGALRTKHSRACNTISALFAL